MNSVMYYFYLFLQNTELINKTSKIEKKSTEIEQCEVKIKEIKLICDERIQEEQNRDEKINQIQERKSKLQNDLQHLINEFGSGK